MNADYFNIIAGKSRFPLIRAFNDAFWPESAARRNLFLEQVAECLRYNQVNQEIAGKAATIIRQPSPLSGSSSLITYAIDNSVNYSFAMSHFLNQMKVETDINLVMPEYLERQVSERLWTINRLKQWSLEAFEPQ